MNIPKSTLKNKLSAFDFYIGTDYAPAILARINLRLDMFAWAGTDLFEWPFYSSKYIIPQQWECENIMTAKLQFQGIKNCRCLPMSLNNEYIVNAISRFGFKGKIINPLPMLYYPNLGKVEIEDSAHVKRATEIAKNSDVLLVQQSRQWWKTAPAHISKGNDTFFVGVAKYVKANPQTKVALVLFEYGADVDNSKKLIENLGLKDLVHWMPKMLRKELLGILSKADIGVGQFGSESWYLYCSNAEIIASGILYMGYRDDDYYLSKSCDLYPMLNANSSEEISKCIDEVVSKTDSAEQKSMRAKKWLIKYNETDFLNNVKKELHINYSRHLPFRARIKLALIKAKMGLIGLLNTLVLGSKSDRLKRLLLEWSKVKSI